MDRREFSKSILTLTTGLGVGLANRPANSADGTVEYIEEKPKKLPVRRFDVLVAGEARQGLSRHLPPDGRALKRC
jgi:hypothetical protein